MLRSRHEDAGRVGAALSGFTAGAAASGARYQSPVATAAVESAGTSAAAIGEAVTWGKITAWALTVRDTVRIFVSCPR